jgi:hypothetical protein
MNYKDFVNVESLSILFGPLITADEDSNNKSSLYNKSNLNPLQKFLLNKKSKKILKDNLIRCNLVKEMLQITNAFYNELLCFDEFSEC